MDLITMAMEVSMVHNEITTVVVVAIVADVEVEEAIKTLLSKETTL